MTGLLAPPLALLDDAALFLDFDGTLVELAETPGGISPSDRLPDLLGRLRRRLDGRVAIVSGRSIDDLDRHLDSGGMAVSGSHGLEIRLASGERLPLSLPHGLGRVRSEVNAYAEKVAGLIAETKPAGVALHYRLAPGEADAAERFMRDLAASSGLALQRGKMVIELRAPGADKGDAVQALMTEPDFAGARPVFVGDDLTDEHAFDAAAMLGGAGILVGPARVTAATWRLDDVAAVEAWLAAAVGVNE